MKQPSVGPSSSGPVILFDGVCNLCNATVLFIVDRDPKGLFRFAALQSAAGAHVLASQANAVRDVDSIVLVDGHGVWTESDAALRIAVALGWPWRAAGAFRVLPRQFRDAVYRWIARNRYRWFGRRDACRLPTPELRGRFLDDPPAPAPG